MKLVLEIGVDEAVLQAYDPVKDRERRETLRLAIALAKAAGRAREA